MTDAEKKYVIVPAELIDGLTKLHNEKYERAKGNDPANQLREEGALSVLTSLSIYLEEYKIIDVKKE